MATATASQDVQARLHVGDTLPTFVFARVVADNTGRFWIALTRGALPAAFVGRHGEVNVTLDLADSTQQTRWHFTAEPSGKGWTTSVSMTSGPDRVLADLGHHPSIRDDVRPSSSVTLARRNDQMLSSLAPGNPDVPCKLIVSEQKLGVNEAWLDAWGWGGGSITAEQGVTAVNTIGIGESFAQGPWGETGTAAVSVSSEQDNQVSRLVNDGVYNRVNANHYVTYACPIGDEYWQTVGFYATVTPLVATTHKYFTQVCVSRGATWSATISNQTNHTFTLGVNYGVISVSSQSGYTTAGTEKFTDSRASVECGNSTQGLQQSTQLEVHSA